MNRINQQITKAEEEFIEKKAEIKRRLAEETERAADELANRITGF